MLGHLTPVAQSGILLSGNQGIRESGKGGDTVTSSAGLTTQLFHFYKEEGAQTWLKKRRS